MIEKRNKKVIFNFFWFEGDIETWQRVQGYKKTFDRHFHLCLSTNENGHREEDERTVGTAYENRQRAERVDEEERGILKAGDKKDRGDSSTDYKGIVDYEFEYEYSCKSDPHCESKIISLRIYN